MNYKEVEEYIAAYVVNHDGEVPKITVERIEELAKIMHIEIEDIFLNFGIRTETWNIKARAKESFIESLLCNDITMDIIGINFDTHEMLLTLRPL